MAAPGRGRVRLLAVPFVWVTTLAQLLAQENTCHYAPRLRSQHQIPSPPPRLRQRRTRQLLERLVYCDETQDISPIYLDIPVYQQLHQTLAVLTSDEIPIPSASAWNCRYCPAPAHFGVSSLR